MDLSGYMRGKRLARLAKPINAVLLLLVVSLAVHWGLASNIASTKEATRSNVALERITPVDAENHVALVRSGAQSIASLLVDQRIPSASVLPDDRGEDQVAPLDQASVLNLYTTATALLRLAPTFSSETAFQARAPPAI